MGEPFGVYVHIPFCAQRCDYCAFVTYVGVDDLHARYVDSLRSEYERSQGEGRVRPATSVFFGGGTPSRLDPDLLGSVLGEIDRAEGCEVTVEVNPEDADADTLGRLVAHGVNRFSIGIQSTAPHVLSGLGRTHRGESVAAIAEAVASSGVSTWSMDLIVGSNEERDEDLIATVNDLLGHQGAPPHLSAYLLTVEKGTPLSRDPARHPDDDVLAHRYELLDELLVGYGYSWYEVSNFSLPEHECRHNQLYWRQGEYLGLGTAAHSHQAARRWWNIANLETYIERVEEGSDPTAGEEVLDEASRAFEGLALALRTSQGVPLGSFRDLDELDGFVVQHGDRLVLTRRGRLVADEMIRRLSVEEGSFSRDPE